MWCGFCVHVCANFMFVGDPVKAPLASCPGQAVVTQRTMVQESEVSELGRPEGAGEGCFPGPQHPEKKAPPGPALQPRHGEICLQLPFVNTSPGVPRATCCAGLCSPQSLPVPTMVQPTNPMHPPLPEIGLIQQAFYQAPRSCGSGIQKGTVETAHLHPTAARAT